MQVEDKELRGVIDLKEACDIIMAPDVGLKKVIK